MFKRTLSLSNASLLSTGRPNCTHVHNHIIILSTETGHRTRHVILYSVQCYALHWTDNYNAVLLTRSNVSYGTKDSRELNYDGDRKVPQEQIYKYHSWS